MEFSLAGALVGGFVATVVMTLMMRMATAAGMTHMPAFELMTGSMISGDEQTAKRAWFVIHWIMMGTIVFGLLYAWLFTALGSASWLVGLVIGLVHGAAVGLVFMPMMPAMHPRMSGEAGGAVTVQGGQVQLGSPGLLGSHWGGMTPVGVLMGHAVYGVVLALVYQLFI